MDRRKNNKGTIGNKGGRKSKAEEQNLIEALTPLMPLAHKALKLALQEQKDWAVKLIYGYYYGLPKQSIKMENKFIEPITFIDATDDNDTYIATPD